MAQEREENPPFDDVTNEYEERLARVEPLRKDLHEYLEKTRSGAYFIRHPFCNEMIHDLKRCAIIHDTIDTRTAKADALFEAHDYEGYINCIEVYSQPEWFAKDAHLLPDDRYWPLLSRIYQTQKYTHYYRDLFDCLFRADRPGRENLMEPEEREVLAKLPDVLTVYRGYSDDDEEGYAEGISWTLDRRQAVLRANWMHNHEYPRVITGKVRKEDVWAYFNGGDLLLPPEAVYDKRDRAAWNAKARGPKKFITKPFDVTALFSE
jgi:hypothetical protein